MSLDVALRGANNTAINADSTYNAAQVVVKGAATVNFDQTDATMDSFERLRVAEPFNVFEYTFGALTPTLATTTWESTAYGAGTEALTSNLYGIDLNTTTATTTGRWLQSYNHIRYTAGVSTLLRFTFNMNALITNVIMRIGMFTDQGTFPSTAGDGLFFEANGNATAFVRRYMSSGATGAEERVLQANWNLDHLDGTGASGVNLDWTLAQHLIIEYQWLGVGTIRFGFETGAKGIVWAHEMVSVNALSTSWSRTGTLPVRAECYSTGALSVAGRLTVINCVVQQECAANNRRPYRYFGGNSGGTGKVGGLTAATYYPVLSLRAASTNDLTKRGRIIPTSVAITVGVVATGPTALQVALLMLPTPNTGATFASTQGGSNTTVDQAATAATAVTGSTLWNTIIPNVVGTYVFDLSDMAIDNTNLIGYNAAGTVAITGSSVLTLGVGPLQTATVGATIFASINWKEMV